jgi:hypothetical protein
MSDDQLQDEVEAILVDEFGLLPAEAESSVRQSLDTSPELWDDGNEELDAYEIAETIALTVEA